MVHSLLLPDLIRCIVLQHSCRCFCSVLCKLQNVSGSIRVLCGSHWQSAIRCCPDFPRWLIWMVCWRCSGVFVFLLCCRSVGGSLYAWHGEDSSDCCLLLHCWLHFCRWPSAVQFACSSYRHLVS